jgi:aerobic carbon-monoxide dehydrogenase small subunit
MLDRPAAQCTIAVTVNGRTYTRTVEPRLLLVDFLRDELGLTGTHIGCDTTSCGACTVHLDGRAVKSCTLFAVQADDRAVRTVEGLAPAPSPLSGRAGPASDVTSSTEPMGESGVESAFRALPQAQGGGEGASLAVGALHPLQQAFHESHALQCGYCTPGMLMSALYLLERNPAPTRDEIKRAIAGNLCRCTGYQFIVDAIALAAARLRGEVR